MQTQELLQIRKQKGMEIARHGKIVNQDGTWIVPSATLPHHSYKVILTIAGPKCNCPDFMERGLRCKHIFAVEITIEKRLNKDGTITETATIRKTYPQDWANYTKAQIEEGHLFKVLLKDLVENVAEPTREGAGRPRVPLREAVFCAIDKVYSMQSSRRAHSRYEDAQEKAQIGKAPSYNVINILLNREDITPILSELLYLTAIPLKSIESKFAVDSTGFRTTKFSEYCKQKHKTNREHMWLKCHAIIGTKTNIITGVEITGEDSADSPRFAPLVNATAEMGFSVKEVYADKAYSSKINYEVVNSLDGVAYIPFRKDANGRARGSVMWKKMYHYFQLNQAEFLEHYHLRSNVETTFMAVKAKFGDCLKNKNLISQRNELLCKLIAYNITVLIGVMYELKLEPNLFA